LCVICALFIQNETKSKRIALNKYDGDSTKRKNREELQEHLRFLRFFVLYFCLKADWNAHKKCDILISQTNQNQEVSRHAQTQRKQE
jgi:predicted GTPase